MQVDYYNACYGPVLLTPHIRRMYMKRGKEWLEKYAKWQWEKEAYKL